MKKGLAVLNAPGTVDSDYRGEIGVVLINLGPEALTIRRGDRIAQLVIAPVVRASLTEVEGLDETVRATGGFGSSGLR
jgi:dUTP pyrophosphatase